MRLFELKYPAYKKDVIPENAIKHCRAYYLDYFKRYSEPALWRGSESDLGELTKVNPRVEGRTSAHTSNEYTVLMSNLPEWSAFPKRSKSLICSYSQDFASTYGETYGVILPTDFRLGVAPREDIWESFRAMNKTFKLEYGMSQFNDSIVQLFGKHASGNTTVEDIEEIFADIQEKVVRVRDTKDKLPPRWAGNPFVVYTYQKIPSEAPPGALFEVVRKCLDPKLNGFSLVTNIKGLPSPNSEDNEVWTDSHLLLVREDSYKEIRKQVLGQ